MTRVRLASVVRFTLTLAVAAGLLGMAAPAWAQHDAVIAGKIVDATGKPVPHATIVVSSIERGDRRELHADGKGEYMGRGFRPERYRVKVIADGYGPVEQEVRARLGMNTVDVTLTPAAVVPDVDYDKLNGLYNDGFEAYRANDWPKAEQLMSELIPQIEPLTGDDAMTMRKSAYEVLGRALLEQDKNDEAIATYEKLVGLDDSNLAGHVWAAQAYTRNKDFEGALPHLVRAAELAPDDAAVQYNAGAILLQLNHVDDGIAAMERAIALRPEFPLARKNLGYAYLRVQKYAEAIEMLQSYLEQAPDAADKADVEGMIEALKAQIKQ